MPDQLQGIVQRMIDAGESEDNIATVIQHFKSQAPPPVERGGLMHPLTSMVAPELEAVRGKVNDALATPHGQPIMARSRTGALYPSETGTGAVNAAKNAGKGFAGGMIDQAEGMTSPLGVAAYGASQIPLAPLARTAATVIENVPYARKVIPFADATAGRLRTIAQGSQDASMGVTRGADMYSMPTVPRSTDSLALKMPIGHGEPAALTAAESVASPAASALSDVERAQLAKQGYSPELINKIAEQAGGASKGAIRTVGRIEPVPSHAPAMSGKSAKFADIPNDPAMADIVDRMAGGADMPSPGNGTMPSEMQQPRVDIGAERVGRANGLSTEQVRQQTAPILGEAPGQASPILPEKALQSIIDKMRSLPREGGAREAYVQAATSGKAQWQIENIRRTLEHLGLLIPAAATVAPSVRDMLLQRMRAGVTAPQTAQ